MKKGGFQAPLKKDEGRSGQFSPPESHLKLRIGKSPTTPKTMPLTQSNSPVLSDRMIPTLKLRIVKSPTTPKTMPLTQSNSPVLSDRMIPTLGKLTFKSLKKSASVMTAEKSKDKKKKSPVGKVKKSPVKRAKNKSKETLAVRMVPQNFQKSPLGHNREIDEGSPSTKPIKKIQKVNKENKEAVSYPDEYYTQLFDQVIAQAMSGKDTTEEVSYPDDYYTQLFDQVIAQAMSGQDTTDEKSDQKSRGTSKNRKAALKGSDSKKSKTTSTVDNSSDSLPKLSQKSFGNAVQSTGVSSPTHFIHYKSLPPTPRCTFSPPGRLSLSQPTVTSNYQMLPNACAREETGKNIKSPLIPMVVCKQILYDPNTKAIKPLAGSALKKMWNSQIEQKPKENRSQTFSSSQENPVRFSNGRFDNSQTRNTETTIEVSQKGSQNYQKMNESFHTPSLNSSQRRSQLSQLLSPLPSNLTPKSRLSWIESRRDVSLWVQCGKKYCRKWRNLENVKDPLEVPHFWECKMNPDKQFASCDAPEKGPNPLEEEDMIHNLYTSGSLVWARVLGFPWWPAMVCDCPDFDQYYWLNGFSDIPTDYHVVFFDLEKYGVSRAWLKPRAIKPYLGCEDDFRFKLAASSKKLYESRLVAAKKQADTASKLPLVERRKKYSFLARWKGPVKNAQGVTEVSPTKDDLYHGSHSESPFSSSDEDYDLKKNSRKRKVKNTGRKLNRRAASRKRAP